MTIGPARMKKRAISILTAGLLLHAWQTPTWSQPAPNNIWQFEDAKELSGKEEDRWIQPVEFRRALLDSTSMNQLLALAPEEDKLRTLPLHMTLPMPDGSFERFRVAESPIMEPQLAAKFPQIRTFVAEGIDDASARGRLDWTPKGFHAQIRTTTGMVYIDPLWRNNAEDYAVYYKKGFGAQTKPFSCLTESDPTEAAKAQSAAAAPWGQTLRTYRLACAATGEYTNFHGGTVPAGMAAIVTAMNRVNGIYEAELAVRMILVANNDLIVYTNGATDPYTNGSGGTMLGQNQSNLTNVIGSANYDIGHVFSTGGGGIASLRSVCSSFSKARGVTGQTSPIGDPFYVDYVAHEMGHQFGGNHTFNGVVGNCGSNRNGSTAYEPGSGSTIQAYAGICGSDNLQFNSDPYFHSISLDEMRNFVTGSGNSCAVQASTGNDAPTVSAGPNRSIPVQTPFTLTASASDPNLDDLTYCWEQRDLGPASSLSAPDNGTIPLFRSFNPTTDPSRTFPRLSEILNNVSNNVEKLPTQSRSLDMRVVVRDNRLGGGGVATDDVVLSVTTSAGPFEFLTPSAGTVNPGDVEVTWAVAGTNLSPVSTSQVNILLSTDGGNSFPITLAAATPNDGTEIVTIPDVATSDARFKIEAVGNVFFTISDSVFIGSCTPSQSVQLTVDGTRNRYLAMNIPGSATQRAIRVTFVDLPGALASLNGSVAWIGPPSSVSEQSASIASQPGFDDFSVSTLQCDPYYEDWSSIPLLHVVHDGIVPEGSYDIQVIEFGCSTANESDYSVPTTVEMSLWGDLVGPFDSGTSTWTPADSSVSIPIDVVALLDKFANRPDAPAKSRADLQPATPDRIINVQDISVAVSAFQGTLYPFTTVAAPCP